MGLNVRRTGAAEYGRYVKMLVCGRPGAGKTLFSSTTPNPIYASAEGGLMSIADRGIPYVDIKTTMDLLQLRVILDQEPAVREEMLGFPVDTVVIDTIDEVQRIFVRERLEDQKKEAMTLPDWGWLSGQMQAVIGGFRALDMHTIFTCHLKSTEDSETGRVWMDPGLQGAIADQIPAAVDLALVLRVDTVAAVEDGNAVRREVRRLITQPSAQYPWIKDRSGKLPTEFDITFTDDFKRLEAIIFGGIDDLQASQSRSVEADPVEDDQGEPVYEMGSEEPVAVIEPEPVIEPVADLETTVSKAMAAKFSEEEEPTIAPEPEVIVVEEKKDEPEYERIVPKNPKPKVEKKVEAKAEAEATCARCGDDVSKDIADLCRIRRVPDVLCMKHYKDWKAENS